MHATDIVHAAGLLFFHHILFVLHSFFFAYILYAGTKKNKNRRKLYTIGLVIVLASIVYELVSYVLGRYLGLSALEIKGVLSLGIIVFIAILVLDLYHDITLRKMEAHERALLIKRANTDLSTEDTTYVESLLEQLKKRIDETNRIIPELNLSISYGYAMRNEIEENITEKVYQLSDNRMYEYKRIYKQQHEE